MREFDAVWPQMLAHMERFEPQFLILQCGADSIAGDPITHLRLSSACHARAARELCALADRLGHGRVLALGGGGYDRGNLARAWSGVVRGAARRLKPAAAVAAALQCGRSAGDPVQSATAARDHPTRQPPHVFEPNAHRGL